MGSLRLDLGAAGGGGSGAGDSPSVVACSFMDGFYGQPAQKEKTSVDCRQCRIAPIPPFGCLSLKGSPERFRGGAFKFLKTTVPKKP
jgi:hypothetical protein